jgi:threonyl-tRNA synthetase
MIHAAIMGSIERFVSVLLEHHAGKLPTWLSPVQVKVLPISDAQLDYSHRLIEKLSTQGIRVELDDRSERLPAKIRDAQLEKVPYMVIIGAKEVEVKKLAIRHRDKGDLGVMSFDEFIKLDEWQK